MRLFHFFLNRFLPLCLLLISLSSSAQDDYTKSGTRVSPTPYPKAHLPEPAKRDHPCSYPFAGTYLIVSRPDLAPVLRPFIQWKKQQGFQVEVILLGSSSRDDIRQALKNRYLASTPLRPAQQYVLLVGDVDRLQGGIGKYAPQGLSPHATDLYYGEYTNDYLPDAFCGRISVADSSQLANVLDKIIRYEKGAFSHAHQILLAAGNESRNNAPITTNGQINYLADMFARFRPALDTVCFRNPQDEDSLVQVLSALAAPNALVNYTAHCSAEGWNNPLVSAAMIDSLHNAIPTLFVNNCCRSNSFNSDCFGERLLRQSQGGAVAVLGATNETFWDEDFYYAVGAKYPVGLHPVFDSTRPGAFDPLWLPKAYNPFYLSIGAMNYAGCAAVTRSGSPYDAYYWEIYCLLGDPSLVPFLGSADTLHVSAPDTILAGATQLVLSASPFARIAITQDTHLLGTTVTDTAGMALISFSRGLVGDSILITATRPGALAWQQSLAVSTPSEGTLALLSASTNSARDSLVLLFTNAGTDTISNHQVILSQNEHEASSGARLPETRQHPIPLLSPGNSIYLSWYIGDCQMGNMPILQAHLDYVSNTHCYGVQSLLLDIDDLRPTLSQLVFLDSLGLPVSQLHQGSAYQAVARYTHSADSVEWFSDSLPTETRYNTSTCSFPLLWPAGQSHYHIQMSAHKDSWSTLDQGWILPYRATETFDSYASDSYPWMPDADFPWTTDSSTSHSGSFCLRSGSIADAQRSSISLNILTLADDSISFFYNVSSQGSDWLYFYVDGQRRGYWSGNTGWRRYARHLTAGPHHLQWIYQKDASGFEREDCARIDDISFPLTLWPSKCGVGIADTADTPLSIGNNAIVKSYPHFSVVPNPASSVVSILTPHDHEPCHITIYDASGKKVDELFIPANCNPTQYSITHLRLGIYLFVAKSAHGTSCCKLSVIR